jgi:hypothetical protein
MKIFTAIIVSLIATAFFMISVVWALPEGNPFVYIAFIVILALIYFFCSRANTSKKAISRGCFLYVVAVLLMPLSLIILGIRETAEAQTGGEAAGAFFGSIILFVFSLIWAFLTGIIAGILGFFLSRD